MYQLDFFPIDPIFEIRKEVKRLEESSNKVRRGTYASINAIGKKFTDQEQRISDLEHKLWVMEKCLKELQK